jgi:hypothetical protein
MIVLRAAVRDLGEFRKESLPPGVRFDIRGSPYNSGELSEFSYTPAKKPAKKRNRPWRPLQPGRA